MLRKSDFKSLLDVKVIESEECVSQPKLLVRDIELNTTFSKSRCIPPKRKLWKLSDLDVLLRFGNCVHESAQFFQSPQNSDRTWNKFKADLLNASDTACGWTRGDKRRRRETWWWSDVVDCAIQEKRRLWKEWQKDGDKKYLQTERKAKSAVYAATKSAQEVKFGDAKSNDQRNQVFKEAYRMKSKNQDIVGYKYINYDDDNLVFDDKSKSAAWKSLYENLLNVEFSWDSSTLSEEQLFQVPPITITTKMVGKALTKTKKGKAAGSSGLKVEMMLAGGNDIILITIHLVNCVVAEGKIPNNRNLSYIINCYKDKGDALLRCNCRGLKLLEQVMKVTGHILATIIRTQVDIDAMRFGSMSRRKTSYGIFILQEVHEESLG